MHESGRRGLRPGSGRHGPSAFDAEATPGDTQPPRGSGHTRIRATRASAWPGVAQPLGVRRGATPGHAAARGVGTYTSSGNAGFGPARWSRALRRSTPRPPPDAQPPRAPRHTRDPATRASTRLDGAGPNGVRLRGHRPTCNRPEHRDIHEPWQRGLRPGSKEQSPTAFDSGATSLDTTAPSIGTYTNPGNAGFGPARWSRALRRSHRPRLTPPPPHRGHSGGTGCHSTGESTALRHSPPPSRLRAVSHIQPLPSGRSTPGLSDAAYASDSRASQPRPDPYAEGLAVFVRAPC